VIAVLPRLAVREMPATDAAAWDALVRTFPNYRVTHLAPWIHSLEAAGCGRPLLLVIEKQGTPVGVLPGLLAQAGPWTMFGSPRAGWQTVSLGPAFDPARVTTAELMTAAVGHLEREHGVAHIELMHAGSTPLDAGAMKALGFQGEPVVTMRAPLVAGDRDATFKRLKDSARRNVSRAKRLGIEVRFTTDDGFVDEHYDQLIEVYRNNGAAIPFSRRRLLACFQHLKDTGHLLAVQAFLPGGRVCIATGTFLVANHELNLWMWAHRTHWRWYRATELMTWTVIEKALELGCTSLDFMGAGDFKARLGAEPDRTKMRWMRSRPRWLLPARAMVGAVFHAQQAVRGGARRAAAAVKERAVRATAGPRAAALVMGDQDLVRALHLAGIRTTLFAAPGQAAAYSRGTAAVLPWIDPGLEPERALAALIAHGQAQSEPPALFYEDDQALLFVSRHRAALRTAFRFVVPDAALVEALVDKNRFQALAQRLTLPVPPALLVDPSRESPDGRELPFPAVVKPLRRTAAWAAVAQGHKALRVESGAMLRSLWPALASLGAPVLVQALVAGPETAIESYHVYVDEKGAVAAEFTGRKIRTWPVDCGDSSALTISDAADVRDAGRDAVKRLKLKGVAKLDFKRAPDGRLYLLEVNPRFTLWHHLAARAGCNIPALVYGDLLALPRPAVTAPRAGATWCKVWTDHAAAREGGIPLHRWLMWALRCDALSAFAWTDPLPLLGAAARKLRGRLWPAAEPDTSVRLAATTVA
jgi:D-aspartate ligase